MWEWMLATIACAALAFWFYPAQAQVMGWKLLLVNMAVLMAYWADRALFRNVPGLDLQDGPKDLAFLGFRTVARALVLVAIVLGLTLGI